MIGVYLQMAIALAAVIGIIFLAGFFLKKRQSKDGLIHVLAYQSLGQRKGIAAMKIGKEILLIGITSTDLKLLKTYEENDLEQETSDINNKLERLKGLKEHLNEHK